MQPLLIKNQFRLLVLVMINIPIISVRVTNRDKYNLPGSTFELLNTIREAMKRQWTIAKIIILKMIFRI